MMCMPGSVGTPGEQSPGVGTGPGARLILPALSTVSCSGAGSNGTGSRNRGFPWSRPDKVRRSVRPNPHAPSLTDRGYRNSPRSRGEASRLHHTGSTARTYTRLWPVGGSALGACIAIRCGVPSDAPIGKYTKTKAMSGCSNDSSPL